MAESSASLEQRVGKLEGEVGEILNLLRAMWEKNTNSGTAEDNDEVPPPQG